MRVWVTKIGEPVMSDGEVRLFRTGMLTLELARLGHDVVWWTSTYSHKLKKQRFLQDHTLFGERYRVELIQARPYKRNVSIERLRHLREIGKRFEDRIHDEPTPDIIVCSFPGNEMLRVVIKYANQYNIPVVIDVRDHWPDKFVELFPHYTEWIAKILFTPMVLQNRNLFSKASSILGISKVQLNWGLKHAGRRQSVLDDVIELGYPELTVSEEALEKARLKVQGLGIEPSKFLCCYIGNITKRNIDLKSIIDVASRLHAVNKDIQFVFCGTGPYLESLKEYAQNLNNVIFLGWAFAPELKCVMEWSAVGLAPYLPEGSMALPNKPFEYLYGGLPIITSLSGELADLLAKYNCGVAYAPYDIDRLLEIIQHLYKHRDLLTEMSKNARNLYKSRFSSSIIYQRYEKHLVKVVDNHLKSSVNSA